jgi:hypothetical protein
MNTGAIIFEVLPCFSHPPFLLHRHRQSTDLWGETTRSCVRGNKTPVSWMAGKLQGGWGTVSLRRTISPHRWQHQHFQQKHLSRLTLWLPSRDRLLSPGSKCSASETIIRTKTKCMKDMKSWDNSVWAMGWTARVRIPAVSNLFLFCTDSRPALGLSQPLIQWVSGAFSPRVIRLGREAHLHPMPRSRTIELYLHSPIRLHSVVGQFNLFMKRIKGSFSL